MSPLEVVLAGLALCAASALPVLVVRRGALIAVVGATLGCVTGLGGAVSALARGWTGSLAAAWSIPGGSLAVGIDPLSAFFLVPPLALGGLCAVYGRRYLAGDAVAAAQLNLLLAAMGLVLLARDPILFLIAWEVMTLLAYLLVTHDHEEAEVRRAGWIYLIASHLGVAALIALFLALGAHVGGTVVLLLALFGFGIKAGVVGLHVWLPEAHAAAPSHVSALMSGALIELGIYGMLRVALLVPPAGWFGITLMVLGALGALAGISLAACQRDLKRVLAYSSVENVGVILLALGLGFVASSRGDAWLAAFAFAGGLLHVWNHAWMKSLLFLGAGSVLHATGTRNVERLGGLLRLMPWTGAAMLVGAVAIAALPPLNGFLGEWLVYRALLHASVDARGGTSLAAAAGAVVLALTGGLASLCFVRLIGVALLGAPRSQGAARASESPPALTVPQWVLVGACAASALGAPAIVSLLAPLLAQLGPVTGGEVAAVSGDLRPVTAASIVLAAVIAPVVWLLARRALRQERADTWGCGYAAPTARMQYTGRAFAELLVTGVLPRFLRAPVRADGPVGPFPEAATLGTIQGDPLTRAIYEPLLDRTGERFARFRFLQQGNVHVYILYIAATLVAALAWVVLRDQVAF